MPNYSALGTPGSEYELRHASTLHIQGEVFQSILLVTRTQFGVPLLLQSAYRGIPTAGFAVSIPPFQDMRSPLPITGGPSGYHLFETGMNQSMSQSWVRVCATTYAREEDVDDRTSEPLNMKILSNTPWRVVKSVFPQLF